jgi:hypothetical protein
MDEVFRKAMRNINMVKTRAGLYRLLLLIPLVWKARISLFLAKSVYTKLTATVSAIGMVNIETNVVC